MNVRALWFAIGLSIAACGGSTGPSTETAILEIRPSDGELQAQLTAKVADAKSRGLKPFVQIYADWCGPCRALRKEMDDPRMKKAMEGVYLIRVEFEPWRAALETALGGKRPGVPVLYEVADDGSVGRSVDGSAWGEDKAENIAPVLSAFFQNQPLPASSAAPAPATPAPSAVYIPPSQGMRADGLKPSDPNAAPAPAAPAPGATAAPAATPSPSATPAPAPH